MIQVEGLSKRFGERMAIENVSFEVAGGEILGFLGPNGAGKTTTMRILTGYLAPSAGRATVDGFDVLQEPMKVKARVGYLPEFPPLYTELLVDEYLHYVAALKGVPSGERSSAVERVARRCGIADVRRRLINNLSKGYRQRVGLAQALIHDPKVVILDEPTSGLDPNQIQEVRALIREIAKDRTVILSTHILTEVENLCDKVAIINEGKIVAVGPPQVLSAGAGGEQRVRLRLARAPARSDLEGALGQVPGFAGVLAAAPSDGKTFEVRLSVPPAGTPDAREQLAALVVQKGWGLLEMRDEGSRLENVFHRLTQGEKASPGGAA